MLGRSFHWALTLSSETRAGSMDEASEERSKEKVAAAAEGEEAKEAPVPERVRPAFAQLARPRLLAPAAARRARRGEPLRTRRRALAVRLCALRSLSRFVRVPPALTSSPAGASGHLAAVRG